MADYYASTQQLQEAIPIYLHLLELEPEDTNAREKLAAGFVLTNQRDKAVEMLEQIIKQHPEKYQTYDLLAGLLDDAARVLEREKKMDEAKTVFSKAAANYEQSLVINPDRPSPYLHLAELLLGPLKESERAVKVKAVVGDSADLARASAMLALGVYRMLNLSRKLRARRARLQKGGAH